MFTGRVIGVAVATRKDPRLHARKLLVVQPVTAGGGSAGQPILAVDLVGAGAGETVMLCRAGDAARAAGLAPVDAAIIGIVDRMDQEDVAGLDLQAMGFRAP